MFRKYVNPDDFAHVDEGIEAMIGEAIYDQYRHMFLTRGQFAENSGEHPRDKIITDAWLTWRIKSRKTARGLR